MIEPCCCSAAAFSNPFATRYVRPGALPYRFTASDEGDSEIRLRRIVRDLGRFRRGLIVGPHGSGKTTLLHSLAPWLQERYAKVADVRLTASPSPRPIDRLGHARRSFRLARRCQSELDGGGLLILDGAEQLFRFDLLRLMSASDHRRQSILATSHHPIRGMAVLHQTTVDRLRIESLTRSLLGGLPAELVKTVEKELSGRDWSTLTNVRDLWFELYDAIGERVTTRDV